MNQTVWLRGARLWCQGLLLFTLRFAQLRTGFDPETGLTVPRTPGTALPILLALFAAAELVWCLRTRREEAGFTRHFAPPGDGAAAAAVLGGMLWAAGGLLMLLTAIPAREVAGGVTGLLSLASGAGMVLLVRQARSGDAPGVPCPPCSWACSWCWRSTCPAPATRFWPGSISPSLRRWAPPAPSPGSRDSSGGRAVSALSSSGEILRSSSASRPWRTAVWRGASSSAARRSC